MIPIIVITDCKAYHALQNGIMLSLLCAESQEEITYLEDLSHRMHLAHQAHHESIAMQN